jgi:aminoglycoside phosphotransferase (APT) family kinase protein
MNIERPDQLKQYLRSMEQIAAGEDPEVYALTGGVSNRTMVVERPNGERWVIKQALEQLRVSAEWTCSRERIYLEALGLRWLEELVPAGMVPGFLFEDTEHYLLAMEAVPERFENWKSMLLEGRLHLNQVEAFARLMATIHQRGYERKTELADDFGDWTYFEALRLKPYYEYTASRVREARGFFERLIRSTQQRRITLVHGDYSPKNILVDGDRLVLLDHEVIHFGDPAFDVGFSMTHLLSKSHHLREHREAFLQAAKRYWKEYFRRVEDVEWTDQLERHVIGHILGCLLARVAGKSKLEYLSETERKRQRDSVIAMLDDRPDDVPGLIRQFKHQITSRE